jgi:hypothetical protein
MNNPPPLFKSEAGPGDGRPKFEPNTLCEVPTQTNFYFLENDDGVVTGNIETITSETKFVGAAGEAFVQYDLLRRDVECHHASGIHSYDLIAIKDYAHIKIEVKTTANVQIQNNGNRRYVYLLNKSHNKNRNKYEKAGVGIFAFVALDISSVVYLKTGDFDTSATMMILHPKDFENTNLTFNRCFL